MNANKLKAAFYFKLPVYTDTIKLGRVNSVIYSLTHSGKKQTSGEIVSLEAGKETETVPCRQIHFRGEAPKQKPPESAQDPHTKLVTDAFMNVSDVVAEVPGYSPVNGKIKEIILWRNEDGNIVCSANILDAECPHSEFRARFRYVAPA